MSFETELAL